MKKINIIITFLLLLPLMAMLSIDTTYCSNEITTYYFIGLASYCCLLFIIFKHSSLIKTEQTDKNN